MARDDSRPRGTGPGNTRPEVLSYTCITYSRPAWDTKLQA